METETPTAIQQALLCTQIIFYATTTLIAVAAGVLGAIKYRLFRAGKPSVSISLEASSRPCSVDQIQIGVTAKLHNGSKVLAKARTLEWECRALGTYENGAIATKLAEYFNAAGGNERRESGHTEFPWNVQQRIIKQDLNVEIEPNETSHDNVTFVVPPYCTAVQIRLFIPTRKDGTRGWTAVIYHDAGTNQTEEA